MKISIQPYQQRSKSGKLVTIDTFEFRIGLSYDLSSKMLRADCHTWAKDVEIDSFTPSVNTENPMWESDEQLAKQLAVECGLVPIDTPIVTTNEVVDDSVTQITAKDKVTDKLGDSDLTTSLEKSPIVTPTDS